MARTIVGATSLILAALLLVPGSLRLWGFLGSHLATRHIQYLPEPLAEFVVFIDGRPVNGDTLLLIATLAGVVFALAGLRILR
jgi:hypothetical protein